METNATEQRAAFVTDWKSRRWTMSELCERYGITRPTGYKWARRFREEGEEGLLEHKRGPRLCPHRTPAAMEEIVVELRRHYGWGAKKLRQVMLRSQPDRPWPARSTINEILGRHGLLQRRKRGQRWRHPGAPSLTTERPNQVWPVDFKGQFRMGNGRYCYPLTVTDHFSRSLLLCHGLASIQFAGVQPVFARLFHEVGLPETIRSDNGAPFAGRGLHGLSRLNVWWMKLGIVHHRIAPSSPQENGAHERMHRELKRETAAPPARGIRSQQKRFDGFRARYNEERPHEALADQVPASRWRPSPRSFPERIAPPEYPDRATVLRVNAGGGIWFRGEQRFLSTALRDEFIALEPIGGGFWDIHFYRTLVGRLDEQTRKVVGAHENLHNV
jgi:putative transposase